MEADTILSPARLAVVQERSPAVQRGHHAKRLMRAQKMVSDFTRANRRPRSVRNYQDPIYKEWRKKVYARDKHCCRWPGCNKRKGLQAHHIMKWSDFPGLRYEIGNGITLCKQHHKMVTGNEDSYAGSFLRILANDRLQ